MQKYVKALPIAPKSVPEDGFPDSAQLAALRAWYEGLSSRKVVTQYLRERKLNGQSSRGLLGQIRRRLAMFARQRNREDLAGVFEQPQSDRGQHARAALGAIERLRGMPLPTPKITDDIGMWLSERSVRALNVHGIKSLADLTVRAARQRRWWAAVPGLGVTGAKQIEVFFAEHPQLVERARALVVRDTQQELVPR